MKFKKYIVPIFIALLLASLASLHAAVLGLDREAYGVWDRSGFHSVTEYPFTRGQEMDYSWAEVNPARSNYNWAAIDQLLQFADDQNQMFTVKIGTVGSGGAGNSHPSWMSNTVPFFKESPDIGFTYGYYLDPDFKIYYEEMVRAFAKHLRQDVAPHLQKRIAFIRCDTGATGDEEPYENGGNVPALYQISAADWLDYKLWAFEVHRQAFQDGTNGPVIPLLFVHCEPIGYPEEWAWVTNNVTGGYGAKYDGSTRGHHLSASRETADQFKPLAVDSNSKIFSRSEMDGTWTWPFFQQNIRLSMYWCAVEQLNAGMSVWDVTGNCLENTYVDGFGLAFDLFNKWAAELVPATAGGGFCIFHEGLDSSDTVKFPTGTYGSPANQGNTNRYAAICAAYASQGARMDDLFAATKGHVWQRPNQVGYNDSGWKIVPGNYDRFITQINPDTTSKGVWRINGATNGVLTGSSHPFDRFARRFDRASGRNAMRFNVNDDLTPNPGQRIQLSVIYLDSGTNQFGLLYDAVGNSQKTAFTVTKSNSNNWKTNSVVVTDWVFGNNGPNGSDLVLTNLGASGDTTFHMLELTKLADVNVGTVGKGTVSGRTDATVYAPIMGTFVERQRLELTVTAAPGWKFSGWSGELSGTNTRPFLFPTKDSRVSAHFAVLSGTNASSVDDFNSGTLTNGTGWSGGWTTSGTVVSGVFVELNGTTGNAQTTRTLAVAVTNASLSFDWDLDRIGAGESGAVSVFNGVWQQVWQQTDPGSDANNAGDANLVTTNINLSALGSISQIRFTLNASGSNNRFYIDTVNVTGTPAVTATNTQPLFSSDPISETPATVGVTYAATLADNASDPGSNPLTFSKLSGPAWLNVATNGVLSGNPTNAIVGLNSWLVRITNGVGGSDDAILLINVNTAVAPSNWAPVFTFDPISRPQAGAGVLYSNTLAGSATDVDAGDPLTYSKLTGPAWLNVATNGTLSGMPTAADVGTNVFTVKVADSAAAFDTATLNIVVLSAYTVWGNQYLLTQGSTGDDDNDGFKNLYEFAVGGNPTNSSDVGYPITYGLKFAGGTNWFEYAYPKRSDPNSGLLYYLELSTNLATPGWTNAGYTVVGSGPLTNGFLFVTNRIETNTKSQQFIRLVVEEP